MTYVSKPMGQRLGIFAPQVEKLRREKGLNDKGFPVKREEDAEAEESENEEGR